MATVIAAKMAQNHNEYGDILEYSHLICFFSLPFLICVSDKLPRGYQLTTSVAKVAIQVAAGLQKTCSGYKSAAGLFWTG